MLSMAMSLTSKPALLLRAVASQQGFPTTATVPRLAFRWRVRNHSTTEALNLTDPKGSQVGSTTAPLSNGCCRDTKSSTPCCILRRTSSCSCHDVSLIGDQGDYGTLHGCHQHLWHSHLVVQRFTAHLEFNEDSCNPTVLQPWNLGA